MQVFSRVNEMEILLKREASDRKVVQEIMALAGRSTDLAFHAPASKTLVCHADGVRMITELADCTHLTLAGIEVVDGRVHDIEGLSLSANASPDRVPLPRLVAAFPYVTRLHLFGDILGEHHEDKGWNVASVLLDLRWVCELSLKRTRISMREVAKMCALIGGDRADTAQIVVSPVVDQIEIRSRQWWDSAESVREGFLVDGGVLEGTPRELLSALNPWRSGSV